MSIFPALSSTRKIGVARGLEEEVSQPAARLKSLACTPRQERLFDGQDGIGHKEELDERDEQKGTYHFAVVDRQARVLVEESPRRHRASNHANRGKESG